MSKNKIHPIDRYAGQRLREARLLRGMNQSELGKALSTPITFQQIQKYENAANRISISRLCELADALKISPSYFLPPTDSHVLPILNVKESHLLENFRGLSENTKTAFANLLHELRRN